MANPKKKALGRGLGALIQRSDSDSPRAERQEAAVSEPAPAAQQAAPAPEPTNLSDGSRLLELDPRSLERNPQQPREQFDEAALEELAASIKQDGVQEPVLVRQVGERYEIISGERRVRASIMADLEKVPVVCREVSDRDMLKLGLIENIQREDLNAMETARAYRRLVDEFSWTQEELADQVGKKRATVANFLRLLQLPKVVQDYLAEGAISMGHARALLAVENVATQLSLARKIVEQGVSVRQAEKLAAETKLPPSEVKPKPPKDPNIAAIEDRLRRSLGAKVALRTQPKGGGKIEIEYFNNEELERILQLLKGPSADPF